MIFFLPELNAERLTAATTCGFMSNFDDTIYDRSDYYVLRYLLGSS